MQKIQIKNWINGNFDNMKKQYTLNELCQKAASYCSISEHCIADVEKKLKNWKVSEPDRIKIIDKLIENDFINEKRYSTSFVRDKFRFNKWGKIKISMALRERKIDNNLISNALNEIDDGEYEELLGRLLKNKEKSIKYEYEYEKQGKLFRFAQSRGFENNIIEKVLRNLPLTSEDG